MGYIHRKNPLLFGGQGFEQRPGTSDFKATFKRGVRTEQIRVVEQPPQRFLECAQSALLSARRQFIGQFVQQPLGRLQWVQIAESEPQPKASHAGKIPLGQFRDPPIPAAQRVLPEIPPDIFVHLDHRQRALGAGRRVKDIHPVGSRPVGRHQDRVDHDINRHQVHDHVVTSREVGQLSSAVGDDQRLGHLQAKDPPGLGIGQAALRDTRPHDGQRHLPTAFDQQLLAHGFGKGVYIVPAVCPGPAHPLLDQLPFDPPPAAVLYQLGQPLFRKPAAVILCQYLPPEFLLLLGALRLRADLLAMRLAVGDLGLWVERLAGRLVLHYLADIAVQGQGLFENGSGTATAHVRGRNVDENRLLAALKGELQQFLGAQRVELNGAVQRLVENHRGPGRDDQVDLGDELCADFFVHAHAEIREIAFKSHHLLPGGGETLGIFPSEAAEYIAGKQFFVEPLCGRDDAAVRLPFGAKQQIEPLDSGQIAQNLGDQTLAVKTRAAGQQHGAACVEISDHGEKMPPAGSHSPVAQRSNEIYIASKIWNTLKLKNTLNNFYAQGSALSPADSASFVASVSAS